jgi:hypothetical protein
VTTVAAGGFDDDVPYWRAVPAPSPQPEATAGTARSVTARLGRDTTATLLRLAEERYRAHADDVLLTALGRVLADWTGRDTVAVAVEGHGREDVLPGADLSRTIGWFTTQYPVTLPTGAGWDETLKAVKEQVRGVPCSAWSPSGDLHEVDGNLTGGSVHAVRSSEPVELRLKAPGPADRSGTYSTSYPTLPARLHPRRRPHR